MRFSRYFMWLSLTAAPRSNGGDIKKCAQLATTPPKRQLIYYIYPHTILSTTFLL
jgi:hypothetical protein